MHITCRKSTFEAKSNFFLPFYHSLRNDSAPNCEEEYFDVARVLFLCVFSNGNFLNSTWLSTIICGLFRSAKIRCKQSCHSSSSRIEQQKQKKKRLRRRKSRFFFSAVARLSEGIKDRRCRFHIHKRIRIFVWTELVAGSMKTEHRCVRRSARSQVNANERASANDSRQRERDKERRTKNMTNVKLNFSSFVWLRCHMVLALGIPMRTSTTSAEHTK